MAATLTRTLSAYLRLMRLHQRAGIWLLLWPCLWSLALHTSGIPSPRLIVLFVLGAVIMRASGCIINDIWDRKIDAQVERTQNRPLASGELSLGQAKGLLALLLIVAAVIAWQLGSDVLLWAAASLPLIVAYPAMKRVTWWPQLFLGITFNWGVLVACVAIRGEVSPSAWLLYAGCIFWTLGYDTLYALQDLEHDRKIGVRSTALRLGRHTLPFVSACYTAACVLWVAATFLTDSTPLALMGCVMMLMALLHQVAQVDIHSPESCARAFRSNVILGWILFLTLLFS